MSLTKREQALQNIRIAVAEDGRESLRSLRIYTEHRISYQAYKRAVAAGLAAHQKLRQLDAIEEANER